MRAPDPYSPEQVHALRAAVRSGGEPTCPICQVPMDRRVVPPRSDISYVRNRMLLVCPECHRNHVVDRAEKR